MVRLYTSKYKQFGVVFRSHCNELLDTFNTLFILLAAFILIQISQRSSTLHTVHSSQVKLKFLTL